MLLPQTQAAEPPQTGKVYLFTTGGRLEYGDYVGGPTRVLEGRFKGMTSWVDAKGLTHYSSGALDFVGNNSGKPKIGRAHV